MSNKDYYSILNINKGASPDEIKKAYRKLAHQHHPDKKGGDEQKFKEINEAYQILSDPKKRSQYDQFGSTFGSQGPGGGFDGFDFSRGFGSGEVNLEDLFDLFGGAFGGQRGARRGREESGRGADIRSNLNIDFHDSARSAVKKIELARDIVCAECEGSGAKKGSDLVDCSVCQGTGEIKETMVSFFGNLSRVYTCTTCLGRGKVPKENCAVCKGEGRKKEKRVLEIKIPGGIRDGETIVVREQGQAGFRGGSAGDLYLHISVQPDKRFQRVGEDLVYELPIKITDALLGAKTIVPTLDGEKEVQIPSGIHDGEEVRLKGLGIHGNHKGDQVLKVKIQIPKKLSSKAKRLVEELSEEL
ncbi:MAG: molecular chaperone DnaJ [Candidatus Paceibacterota bacterium]